jgi:hypothetical protein
VVAGAAAVAGVATLEVRRSPLPHTPSHGSQLLYARTTVRSERKLDHCLTLRHPINSTFGLLGSWFGPEVAFNWLFPYPHIILYYPLPTQVSPPRSLNQLNIWTPRLLSLVRTNSTPSGGCSGQRACPHAQLGIPETAHGPTLEHQQLPHNNSTHSHWSGDGVPN